MGELFVHHHIGLGDHFACHGIIRYISQHMNSFIENRCFDKIHVFAIDSHYPIIEYMYRDDSRINVQNVGTYETEYEMVNRIVSECNNSDKLLIKIGHEFYGGAGGRDVLENKNCWEYFYDQVNM